MIYFYYKYPSTASVLYLLEGVFTYWKNFNVIYLFTALLDNQSFYYVWIKTNRFFHNAPCQHVWSKNPTRSTVTATVYSLRVLKLMPITNTSYEISTIKRLKSFNCWINSPENCLLPYLSIHLCFFRKCLLRSCICVTIIK